MHCPHDGVKLEEKNGHLYEFAGHRIEEHVCPQCSTMWEVLYETGYEDKLIHLAPQDSE